MIKLSFSLLISVLKLSWVALQTAINNTEYKEEEEKVSWFSN